VRQYADAQSVGVVAVSNDVMLYAADLVHGGPRGRVFCALEHCGPEDSLWWLSVDGIYRPRSEVVVLPPPPPPDGGATDGEGPQADGHLLHPKYGLPARCFAHVGDATDPRTWHLPYLKQDATVDLKRLPKAVQAVLSNYRGAHVSSVPECDVPDVLVRLACAAASIGKLPGQTSQPASAYVQLFAALEQLDRLEEVLRNVQSAQQPHRPAA
jgi:hypothetical protein